MRSIAEQVLEARRSSVFASLPDFGIIRITGPDAESYLQGRTSNDVKQLTDGSGQLTCLLHRKGHMLALFSLHRLSKDEFVILVDKQQIDCILEQLETYKFREKITFHDASGLYELYAVQGPDSSACLHECHWENLPEQEYGIAGVENSLIIRRTLTGDVGFILALHVSSRELETFNSVKATRVQLDAQAMEVLRIEAGLPSFGTDMNSDYLLPETGLEQYTASYSKGCFQGQEVLARIKTYGAPRQALVGLVFATPVENAIALNTRIVVDGQEIGTIKSNTQSPTLGCYIALAYVAREYRVPGAEIEFTTTNGTHHKAKVEFLPIYKPESNKEKAQRIYSRALNEFAHGSENQSIQMLRQAVDLDPGFTDAYESLGVILSRQNQLDEAIALMHRLAELDPQSIMAHANLSLYYMQLGEIEKAEEQKAISMSIQMSKIAKEVVAKQKQDEERKKKAEEAVGRIEMFSQVLKIDSEDLLANYGMGSALIDMGKADEAVEYLHKAIKVKPSHTVAWLALGKALEDLGRFDNAIETYEKGVETAAKRGDITPMNEMKSRLFELQQKLSATKK